MRGAGVRQVDREGMSHSVQHERSRQRLERARAEIALCGNYDYIIINEEGAVEQTAQRIAEILRAEQCRTPRMQPIIEHFFKSEQGGEKE